MSEIKIVATLRESFGKGAARKLRATHQTPAVIYGHGHATRHISLPAHEIALALRHKNALLELSIEGKTELVLVKMASKDPVTQIIEHVDLVEVIKGEKVHVVVPVHLVGEPMSGTVVDLEHKTVKLEAEATHVPEFVELRISKEAAAGHHYLAGELVLPQGVTLDIAAGELVASVVETKAGAAGEDTPEAGPAAE
ncbi:MAG: 50S ribosomal protein L25/general stress protein Ctc [Aquiluna sp.]|jgi:large subunit ribosomal protein L25|nr:50S ribosomal protein L25/general stress protein Ctc [Aquiluna sp.]